MSDLLQKLEAINIHFEEIGQKITDPAIINDMARYVKLNKEYKDLEDIVNVYKEYKNVIGNIKSSKEILNSDEDAEMKEMAKMELEELEPRREVLEEEIKVLLIPKDPEDDKNVLLELRAGTGGDEASIFAGDLYRMYTRYFDDKGWKVDVMNVTEGTVGGYKEVILKVTGDEVYGALKYEAGVHRVQRVPETETQGRVHTSAATVAVLPEAEEIDVKIEEKDLRIDVFRSSGPGGQSVNTTDSAVRITHMPTGIIVSQQDEKSQIRNKEKGMKILRARIYEFERKKKENERSKDRKSKIGTGDRSERIRTYNFPQGRVTDHRINLTLHKLDKFLEGEIFDEMIENLNLQAQKEKLNNLI